MGRSALEGIKVLDLSTRYAGAWCTRLLADFGADVWLADPHPVRDYPPFDAEGRSIPAAYVLANKRSFSLDGRQGDLDRLIDKADIVVDTALPGTAEHERLGYARLAEGRPWLIQCSITPHGQTGARATLFGNELTANALSGWASVNGLKSREPLKASGFQAAYQTGTAAYAAILCALVFRDGRDGEGQHIDVAEDDVLTATFAPGILRSLLQGEPWSRRDAVDFTNGPVPVADGHFALTLSRPHFWTGAMDLLGLPELGADENLQKGWYRNQHKEAFVDAVEARMTEWTRMELFGALAKMRVVAGPVLSMADLAENAHLRARGFFVRADGANSPEFPGAPAKLGASPWRLRRRAPDPGADTEAVLRDADEAPRPAIPRSDRGVPTGGALAGYRGVVLTQAWAGTLATELLGLMGAEIIQVEAPVRMDSWRGQADGPMPRMLGDVETARHPWNCNPLFNSVNLNKQSATLDLAAPEGVALFKRLVAKADFVAENFSPRVMGNLGLDYAALKAVKPDIVLCSLSAYGHDGPWAPIPGIGGTIEPSSGMSALLGYEGGPPMNSGQMYPDAVAGLVGFAAIATALYHRDRTDEGQFIDLSMQEANLAFVGDAWLEYAATGRLRPRLGNRDLRIAPHGIYPCAGEDKWIALAAETEDQWRALAEAAGRPDWRARFPDNETRRRDEEALDAEIAGWTAGEDRDRLFERLAGRGVIAAPVLDAVELARDEVYRARGVVTDIDHTETGPHAQAAIPFLLSRTPARITRPAPLKDEHSAEIFARLLGMGEREYQALVARGVTGLRAGANA